MRIRKFLSCLLLSTRQRNQFTQQSLFDGYLTTQLSDTHRDKQIIIKT